MNINISPSTRIQYLGYITQNIKNKIGFYHVNYVFLLGIYEFGKHRKNMIMIYQDTYKYNTNERSDRNKILNIRNWFHLQEDLCSCHGGEYVDRITRQNECSLCGNSPQDQVHYNTDIEIKHIIEERFILKFTLLLGVD